jgi:iron(III) transport system ATP-binding protein
VAVLMRGRIAQIGTSHEVYLRPASREVASFVGDANFMPGHAHGERAECALGQVRLMSRASGSVELMIRPEALRLVPEPDASARVEKLTFYGHDQMVRVRLESGQVLDARTKPMPGIAVGQPVDVVVRGAVMAFPPA